MKLYAVDFYRNEHHQTEYETAQNKREAIQKVLDRKLGPITKITAFETDHKINNTMHNLDEFTGVDVDPEISLFEYGIIWKDSDRAEDEIFCIIQVPAPVDGTPMYGTGYFDQSDLDFIDLPEVLDYTGQTREQWENDSLGYKIQTAISYYGALEFVSPYGAMTEQRLKELIT